MVDPTPPAPAPGRRRAPPKPLIAALLLAAVLIAWLLFRDEDFDAGCFASAGVFHACSNSLTDADIAATTLSGMARARAAGALVSVDLNLRPVLWPNATPALPVLWRALEAADLIKLAMIDIWHWIGQEKLSSRLIMQVHDELVLEVE